MITRREMMKTMAGSAAVVSQLFAAIALAEAAEGGATDAGKAPNPLASDKGVTVRPIMQHEMPDAPGKQVSIVAANSTDGALTKLDVKVLKDDKQAFPPYQACILVRSDTLAANPELRKTLSELSGKISDNAMRTMNYAVDVEHKQVREVARDFLEKAALSQR